MPDDLQCLLGRMQQRIEDIKTDLEEIRDEQKKLSEYVNTQKVGIRFILSVLTTIGAVLIALHEEVFKLLGLKLSN